MTRKVTFYMAGGSFSTRMEDSVVATVAERAEIAWSGGPAGLTVKDPERDGPTLVNLSLVTMIWVGEVED